MISSLSSGVTNVAKDVLGLTISILAYGWLVQNIAITHIEATWLTYMIAFFVIDFAGYWVHRWSHHVNVFWNLHIIHHSSEEFNLACALRQSISMFVKSLHFPFDTCSPVGRTDRSDRNCWATSIYLPNSGTIPSISIKWVSWKISSLLLLIIVCTMQSIKNISIRTFGRSLFSGINYLALTKRN